MIDRFEIIAHGASRPDAEHIVFCDGAGGELFRDVADLELSHWRPNRTPAEYRAGTSTEICFRFVDHPQPGEWTAAVNNHVDVDGILSVYALVCSEHALRRRETIIAAAEMGDFWGWGEPPAQRVFQGLTRLMRSGGEGRAIYAEAFRRIPALIDGTDPETTVIEASLAPLRRGAELVEQGRIARSFLGDRLAHYIVPRDIAGDDARASYVPGFNEAISDKAGLWPQVLARSDAERISLVSFERAGGWFHDLYFPGYQWADAAGRWFVPGMHYHDGMSSYDLDNPGLIAAFAELQRQETAPGQWSLGGTNLPFGVELQEQFPLVGRVLDEAGQVAISQVEPEIVARVIGERFGA
ncbi:MAG TPA: DUF6687 family protein [Pirellulales bacterium]|nr:DUF6687 family protein [Pirellulales bacterium]